MFLLPESGLKCQMEFIDSSTIIICPAFNFLNRISRKPYAKQVSGVWLSANL